MNAAPGAEGKKRRIYRTCGEIEAYRILLRQLLFYRFYRWLIPLLGKHIRIFQNIKATFRTCFQVALRYQHLVRRVYRVHCYSQLRGEAPFTGKPVPCLQLAGLDLPGQAVIDLLVEGAFVCGVQI